MKFSRAFLSATAALVFLCVSGAADAKGCLKGAAVGGVGGHIAGHHGLLGAAGGCLVGRHMANKKDKEAAAAPTSTASPSSPSSNDKK
jgi:hypothetical protein